MGNDIARDAHCDITTGNDVTRDIHSDVTMSSDVSMCTYHGITMHNYVAMNLLLLCITIIPAKPLHNSDTGSVHFNHFYCMGICDKLSRH